MILTGGPIADYEVRFSSGIESMIWERTLSSDEFHNRISDLYDKMRNLESYPPTTQLKYKLSKRNQLPTTRSKSTSKQQMSTENEVERGTITRCEKKSSIDVLSKLKTRPSSSKKKSSRGTIDYSTSTNDDRLMHSNRLGCIFEEAADIFKERRQRLNDLAIKNSAPKQKSPCKVQTHVDDSEVVYHNTSLESKAGKTFFPVIIGHEEYL
ncbi:hypothetical protein ACHAXN_000860 [Cyclotella atomus]|jgi:hypothetical protein